MTTYAKFKTTAVELVPIAPTQAPLGSLYLDSSNSNAMSTKTTGGSNVQLGAATSADLMIKNKRNMTGTTIAAYKRVALKSDGTICLADSDNAVAMTDIGVTLDPITDSSYGRVMTNAANAAGVLTGLGYTAGQVIYLSKTPGGLTNDPSIFNPETDAIVQVGIADCATDVASGTATDLIMMIEVQSRP